MQAPRKTRRFLVLLTIPLLLLFLSALWLALRPAQTHALTVTCLSITNNSGHYKLRVAVTNLGSGTVLATARGYLEIRGRTNPIPVGATTPLRQLAPGQGHIIEATLSPQQFAALHPEWRYTCRYARADLRSRFNQWQWSPSGPGARLNWLVPARFKGTPLNVIGVSAWVESSSLTN